MRRKWGCKSKKSTWEETNKVTTDASITASSVREEDTVFLS